MILLLDHNLLHSCESYAYHLEQHNKTKFSMTNTELLLNVFIHSWPLGSIDLGCTFSINLISKILIFLEHNQVLDSFHVPASIIWVESFSPLYWFPGPLTSLSASTISIWYQWNDFWRTSTERICSRGTIRVAPYAGWQQLWQSNMTDTLLVFQFIMMSFREP